ncbi:hypothetical protein IMZ48_36345, partial [Candidatus Bathyarchaeota archaeon]|nr:hypothetical protein [Candidatus Bathyarchaeota archaeon]
SGLLSGSNLVALDDSPATKDKHYRKYAAAVERALSLFETTLQEWADYISFLNRLLKVRTDSSVPDCRGGARLTCVDLLVAAISPLVRSCDPLESPCREAPVAMSQPVSALRGTPEDPRGLQPHLFRHREGGPIPRSPALLPGSGAHSFVRISVRPFAVPRYPRNPLLGPPFWGAPTSNEVNHPRASTGTRG